MFRTGANPVSLRTANLAVLAVGRGDCVANLETGHGFVAKTPETFTYDADGNLLSDGRWNYTWELAREIGRFEGARGQPVPVEWQCCRITGRFISRAKEIRLVKVESCSDTPQASWRRVEWQYDALGRRIRQTTWNWLVQSNLWVVTEGHFQLPDPSAAIGQCPEIARCAEAVSRNGTR